MIILLGATGYIGEAFAAELRRRGRPFCPLTRKELDYTRFDVLRDFLHKTKPSFLINAAGYTGKPNVDACEAAKAETLQGNTLLVQTVAHACCAARIAWGHVSSGCIYNGAKIARNGRFEIEADLTKPLVRPLVEAQDPALQGFSEGDEPNFSFRSPPCSFYSGTKALTEEILRDISNVFIWRLRIPFDEVDHARNYLSKLMRYPKLYENINSISHRGDFVRACLDLWETQAAYGIYNVTNSGYVSTRQVANMIEKVLKRQKRFEFWANDEEFYRVAVKSPRSNCILDNSKLLATGVKMRPVEEALEEALRRWIA